MLVGGEGGLLSELAGVAPLLCMLTICRSTAYAGSG